MSAWSRPPPHRPPPPPSRPSPSRMARIATVHGGHGLPRLDLGVDPTRATPEEVRHHAVTGGIPNLGRPASETAHGLSVREFTEAYVATDPVLRHAMAWGKELGAAPVRPAAGAVLRLLATATSARTAVGDGTGTGASGPWLLGGMHPAGVLTTIDVEPEVQGLARQAFAAAGHAPGRTRIITADAREVLPRLADRGYDLVFLDGPAEDHPTSVEAAARI